MHAGGLILVASVMVLSACTPANVVDEDAEALSEVMSAVMKRPIEDFLSAQGTVCVGEGGVGCVEDGQECFLFVPPDPNFLGWTNDPDTNKDGVADKPLLFTGIDYAGLAGGYTGDDRPVIGGTITERPLPDGRAEVKIVMHTEGANAWVMALDPAGDIFEQIANKPTLFGHRPRDVIAGAGQALADTTLGVTFINTAPGAPLPDLVQFVQGCVAEGVEQASLQFVAHAAGPLTQEYGVAEGTPGRATVNQTGRFGTHTNADDHGVGDGYPAEFVELKVVGH